MTEVWKYHLPVLDIVEIRMPLGATMLTVQEQNGACCLWAEVDPEAEWSTYRFRISGTGHNLHAGLQDPERLQYVGTFQLHGGQFVGHVYSIQGEAE